MMETKEIQNELIRTGKENGMCDKFMSRLESGPLTIDQMCGLFHAGLDFCIEHNWPNLDFVKEAFDERSLAKNGIYHTGIHNSKSQKNVVTMGDALVDVYIPANGVCDIYCRHNSVVRIHAGEHAFVYVSCYDDGKVDVIESANDAKLCASFYSGEINNTDKFDKIHRK